MRRAVLITGILGACGAGILGVLWLLSASTVEATVKLLTGQTLTEVLSRGLDPASSADLSKLQEALNDYHWAKICIWFLLASAVLGLFGSILGLRGKRAGAAVLLLAAFVAPFLLIPSTAVFTFFLALAGLLALFIKPRVQPA